MIDNKWVGRPSAALGNSSSQNWRVRWLAPARILLCIITCILSPWYTPLTRWCSARFCRDWQDNQSYSMIDKLELSYYNRTLTSGAKWHLVVVTSTNTHKRIWTADQFGVNEPLYRWAIWACLCIYYTTVLFTREELFSFIFIKPHLGLEPRTSCLIDSCFTC